MMRYPKFRLAPMAGGVVLLIAPCTCADFSGSYAPANWTFTNSPPNTGGSFTNDGTTLVLTGGDNGSGFPGTSDYKIIAVGTGAFSFHWVFTSTDTGFDDAGYFINNNYIILGTSDDGFDQGDVSVVVSAGDIIGFRAHTFDNLFGPGVLHVTNFSGPLPSPAGFALLFSAVAGWSPRRR